MTRQLYEEPILIRAVSERRDTVSIHADLEAQSINNPMVSPKVSATTVNIVRLSVSLLISLDGASPNVVSPSWR